jgi:lipopolysaccharide export system ATP-binding protein
LEKRVRGDSASRARLFEGVGLVKRYRGRNVVDDVSVQVCSGEVVGLLGPNGAGKTTLFYMLAGIVSPDSGKIRLDGSDMTDMPLASRAVAGISYLPQERSVFQGLSVRQNIEAVVQMRHMSSDIDLNDMVKTLVSEFDLDDVALSPGRKLSGGEARRLEIARALAMEPSFLLMDALCRS